MNHSLKNKIKAFLLLGLAVFLLLSLASYSYNDTPLRTSHPNIPSKNLTGIVGAYTAEGLVFSFGWAAYIICLILLVWALARFVEKPAPKFYVKIIGTLVLLLSLSVLLSLFGPSSDELNFQRAGLSGTLISGFLVKYFGHAGTLIITLSLGLLAAFVATEFLLWPLLRRLCRTLARFILGGKKLASLFTALNKRQPSTFTLAKKKKPQEKAAPALKIEEARVVSPAALPIKLPKLKPRIVEPQAVKQPALPKTSRAQEPLSDYKLPAFDLLNSPPPLKDRQIKDDLEANSRILEATLRDFNVETRITQVSRGPVITRYELEPAPGVKIHRIVELSDDIALAMKAQSVRIVAPIPGKARVGVEVPNSQTNIVYLKEVLESQEFQQAQSKLTLAVGKDISGEALTADLAEMPHLLIAGTTGSGKTVCVNSIIASLLFNATPDELKFVMVDPKMVELAAFNDLAHLLCPVLTDPKKVAIALAWLVNEMEERYKLLAKLGARNIDSYNEKLGTADGADKSAGGADTQAARMPYIVVIIDELADLMAVVPQEVENAITRLAQLSRAVGIHLILATQRPSVDVVTGVIKANFPARISFRVASKVDSRTVLDMNGADKLLGSGDLLFLRPGQPKPVRAQASLISDAEIERLVAFIKQQRTPVHNPELMEAQERKSAFSKKFERDELFDEAVKVILQTRQASVSMLQRRLGLGYTRAARLIDMMEEEGIVGPYRGSKPREILAEKDSLTQQAQEEQG